MAQSRSNNPELLELGSKFYDSYNLDAYGWLARESRAIPKTLCGNGDISKMASMLSGLASNNEAVSAPVGVDPVFNVISPVRDKARGVWSMSSEVMEDGFVVDDTLRGIAQLIAEYKDASIIDNMLLELSPSTIVNQAALSLGDVLAQAALLPSMSVLPSVYLSSKSYFSLKALEHAAGLDSGSGMVAGLPAVFVNGGNSDVSDSFVMAVGSAGLALGYAQYDDKVVATDQALDVPNANTDSVSIVARCRFAHCVLDDRYLKVVSVA